jgi:putative addiction module component (TIGR02574 family)
MSLTEILAEIPKLSFAERQELVRHAIALEAEELTPEENAILDERLADFGRNPGSGIPADELKSSVLSRIKNQ